MNLFYKDDSLKIISNNAFLHTHNHQNLVLSYLDPYLPYRSLFLCFQLGAGKTYTAAALSFLYIKEGFKVLFLSNSVASVNNFNVEFKKLLFDSRMKEFESKSSKIKKMTYSKFYYSKDIKNQYGLIILDEAHNLKDSGLRYIDIKNKIKLLSFAKILIISGTPMFDSIKELPAILNITEETTHVMFADDFKLNKDIKINYIGKKVGGNVLFLSKLRGKQLEIYNQVKKDRDPVFSNIRQASISFNNNFDPTISLNEQSSKIAKLMDVLDENSTNVVFSFYVKRGVNFLTQVLKHYGYIDFLDNSMKSNTKKYAVITGNTSIEDVNYIINQYNDFGNINGTIINVLIGSSVLSESITLLRTKNVHILNPHWNFSQIDQSLGRVLRLNSHILSPDKTLNIYLHAAYEYKDNNNYIGKDLDIIGIASDKKHDISDALINLKEINKIDYINQEYQLPQSDNNLIFNHNKYIWDFTQCFDQNKYKISWCVYNEQKLVIYDKHTKKKMFGASPSRYFNINLPLEGGYTIWRSCIDNRLRISNIEDKNKKVQSRGKLLQNLKINEINKIASDLNCKEYTIDSIIRTLKNNKRYFNKQIELRK